MFQSQESKVAAILLLTFALLLITGVFPQYMLVTTAVFVTLGALFGLYLWLAGRKRGERPDERSERCSLLATRNGFLAGILLTAFMAVAVQLGFTLDLLAALRSIWALTMSVYFLSYLAYKRFGLA